MTSQYRRSHWPNKLFITISNWSSMHKVCENGMHINEKKTEEMLIHFETKINRISSLLLVKLLKEYLISNFYELLLAQIYLGMHM